MNPVLSALTDIEIAPSGLDEVLEQMQVELATFRTADFLQRQRQRIRDLSVVIPVEALTIAGYAPNVSMEPSPSQPPGEDDVQEDEP